MEAAPPFDQVFSGGGLMGTLIIGLVGPGQMGPAKLAAMVAM